MKTINGNSYSFSQFENYSNRMILNFQIDGEIVKKDLYTTNKGINSAMSDLKALLPEKVEDICCVDVYSLEEDKLASELIKEMLEGL